MPLIFSGEKKEHITHIAYSAEDASSGERVTVLVTHDAKIDYDLAAIRAVASRMYDAGPRASFLVGIKDMEAAGYEAGSIPPVTPVGKSY